MYLASQTRTWPKKNNNNKIKLPGQCTGSKLNKGRRNTKTRSLYRHIERTGHYLSPGGGEGGGDGGFFGGITWFLWEQKGGSLVTENPKEGITETYGRIQRANHSNLLGKRRHMGGGGGRENHQNLLGGITSVKQHSNGGSIKFHFAGDKQWPVPNLHVQLSSTYLKINLDRPKNTRINKISNKHIY